MRSSRKLFEGADSVNPYCLYLFFPSSFFLEAKYDGWSCSHRLATRKWKTCSKDNGEGRWTKVEALIISQRHCTPSGLSVSRFKWKEILPNIQRNQIREWNKTLKDNSIALEWSGGWQRRKQVQSIAQILMEEAAKGEIKSRWRRGLKGLKVGCKYCQNVEWNFL